MAVPTLDIPSPFSRVIFLHIVVEEYVEVIWLHDGLEGNIRIVSPATGTVAVLKK
jgi:hypothetical protein